MVEEVALSAVENWIALYSKANRGLWRRGCDDRDSFLGPALVHRPVGR